MSFKRVVDFLKGAGLGLLLFIGFVAVATGVRIVVDLIPEPVFLVGVPLIVIGGAGILYAFKQGERS
jgi:hypothetical protein